MSKKRFFIPGISDIKDPDEREEKIQKDIEDVMNKYVQLKNFKKEDLQEGGRFHKSFLKFKMEFQEKAWNYILYYLTQYLYIPDSDVLTEYLNRDETKNMLSKILNHLRENRKDDADNLIGYLREVYINTVFSYC